MTQSNRPDVTFYVEEFRFSVRCSVFLKNQHGEILVQKKKTDDDASWALPGGRLKVGESIVAGVIREIVEEFGVQTIDHRFLGVIEQNIKIGDQKMHEHNYLFAAEYSGDVVLCDETLDWKWVASQEIDSIKPRGCADLLKSNSSMISNGFDSETEK